MMNNSISKEFNFISLIKFAMPTIIMMIFMSLYSIVDGIFISRFVGTDALSATNIVYPVINIIIGISIMLATGSSAIIARKIGEDKVQQAREAFSLIIFISVVIGIIVAVIGVIFIKPIIYMLGGTEAIFNYCRDYLKILLIFAPASILQLMFQSLFVTAGKPHIGLILTIISGIMNAIFDYVFIVLMDMGIKGAAFGTTTGYLLPSAFGIIYFVSKKNNLHFVKFKIDWKIIIDSCFNGSSEMVTNISSGIITFLFNLIMMRYLGEDGVAAITIILYAQFLFTALYIGFSLGISPVISYNYGSSNTKMLKKIFKICMTFIICSSILVFIFSLLFSKSIVAVFAQEGTNVYEIAINGFILFSLSYLFAGINIFTSSMFTAFSNGKISAIISFMRTFVFIVIGIVVLPIFLEVNGIWLAVPFAEILSIILSLSYLLSQKSIYHYA